MKKYILTVLAALSLSVNAGEVQTPPYCVQPPKKPHKKHVVKPKPKPEVKIVYVYVHDAGPTVVNNVYKEQPSTRIYGILGAGPTRIETTIEPGLYQFRKITGTVYGAGIQESIERFNFGALVLSNYTTAITLGLDF